MDAAQALRRARRVLFLTGAGISAESGLPTFRGPEGYWRVGSQNYRPEHMATAAMFAREPGAVWRWYLHRRAAYHRATPNAGHLAVVAAERHLGAAFWLVTQNVDGLHLRAGNSLERTTMIHGNVDFMRCTATCTQDLQPVPDAATTASDPLTHLSCSRCGAPTRPHVLWFDECYDDVHYGFSQSLAAADIADALVTVGSAGATNLPRQIADRCAARGTLMIDINPEPNPFGDLAARSGGYALRGSAAETLPALIQEAGWA